MNILLVGNPNVGKSALFNALTGAYIDVSNYPGTTVEVAQGAMTVDGKRFTVIDTPGINGLKPHSEDERVTADILSRGDIGCVVHVADSKNMKRSLLLTADLLKLDLPLVLVLNMSDEAKARGIRIDIARLSGKLGVTVIETVATTREGVGRLVETIAGTARANERPVHGKIKSVDALIKETVSVAAPLMPDIRDVIGRITMQPLTGVPILFAVLLLLYLFVGYLAAGKVVSFLEGRIFGGIINPFAEHIVRQAIPWGFFQDLLVGRYGIITMACTYALAIILPIVTAFFLFLGVLEDSGYLPRLSVLSDRIFRKIGLNGRAILPMILGLGCVTMATLTTRILETKKERLLLSALLTLAVPCSAQLGVILGILGGMSMRALFLWMAVILAVLLAAGFLGSKILPGKRSPFIQEIPPIRFPQFDNIGAKTAARLKWYLREAVPLFVIGTLVLFISDKIGLLAFIERAFTPFMDHLLGLPPKMAEIFIVGFLRRDYGAAGLYSLVSSGELTHVQTMVAIVTMTLFIPCIAQFFMMAKERGVKTACLVAGIVTCIALMVGGVLNLVFQACIRYGIQLV